jgi:hypothetical protein
MENNLSKIFHQPGWDLSFSEEVLVINCPSVAEATVLVKTTATLLTSWASKFGLPILIKAPDCARPIKVPPLIKRENSMTHSNSQGKQSLQFAEALLPPELIRFLFKWSENSNIKGGIVELPSEKQIVLTQGCDKPQFCIWGIGTGVQKSRPDFWYLPDLEAMRQRTQQESEFEFTWHSRLQRPDGSFAKFTNHYQVITDSLGNKYQVSENIGFDLVPGLPLLV